MSDEDEETKCIIRRCTEKVSSDKDIVCQKHIKTAKACDSCKKWFLKQSLKQKGLCSKCFDDKLCKQQGGMYGTASNTKTATEIANQFEFYQNVTDPDTDPDEIIREGFVDFVNDNNAQTSEVTLKTLVDEKTKELWHSQLAQTRKRTLNMHESHQNRRASQRQSKRLKTIHHDSDDDSGEEEYQFSSLKASTK